MRARALEADFHTHGPLVPAELTGGDYPHGLGLRMEARHGLDLFDWLNGHDELFLECMQEVGCLVLDGAEVDPSRAWPQRFKVPPYKPSTCMPFHVDLNTATGQTDPIVNILFHDDRLKSRGMKTVVAGHTLVTKATDAVMLDTVRQQNKNPQASKCVQAWQKQMRRIMEGRQANQRSTEYAQIMGLSNVIHQLNAERRHYEADGNYTGLARAEAGIDHINELVREIVARCGKGVYEHDWTQPLNIGTVLITDNSPVHPGRLPRTYHGRVKAADTPEGSNSV